MIIKKKELLINIGTYSLYTIILFDFLTKILNTYNFASFTRFSLIPKLIINSILLFYIIKTFDLKKHIYVVSYFLMFLLSMFAFFSLHNDYGLKVVFNQVYILLLYSYPFILVVFFNTIDFEKKQKIILSLEKPIINIGIISCILTIVGLLTNMELFRSYDYSDRFGFNGVFSKTSEASYYFMNLIALSFVNYLKFKKPLWVLLSFFVFSLFIGTKVVWLFIALTFFYFLILKHKKTTLTITFLLSTIYFIKKDFIDSVLIKYLPNGDYLYAKSGMLTVLTSTRDLLFNKLILYTSENWQLVNYLFGGNRYRVLKVEFEIIDLISMFGIVGIIFFILFIKYYFFKNNQSYESKVFVILILICSLFAGNFFKSFLVFTIFYFTCELINIKTKEKQLET